MPSQLDICNRALMRLGVSPINDINEQTPQGVTCQQLFAGTLAYILRENTWSFATKRAALAAVPGIPPVDWMYIYAYPGDCQSLIQLYPARVSADALPDRLHSGRGLNVRPMGDVEPFDLGVNENDVKVVYTNLENPVAKYTKRITNVNNIDDMAADALSWRLAFEMAQALTGDEAKLQIAAQGYSDSIARAASATRNEAQMMAPRQSTYIGARRGGRYR